jgi:hypothetical protein
VHIESEKSYIGSAKNLSIRFKQYFSYNHLTAPKRNMTIYKALLKYGYGGFRLEVLEYCDLQVLLKREQFYMDKFYPEYNILNFAGSSLGYVYSEASRAKMSISQIGKKAGEKNHMFGKHNPRPKGAGRPYQKIEVIDIKNNITTIYDSIALAALALKTHHSSISNYFARNQKLYKNQYAFKKL